MPFEPLVLAQAMVKTGNSVSILNRNGGAKLAAPIIAYKDIK